MILTLGFDSFLEKKYYIEKFYPSKKNEVEVYQYGLGGESINTSRILKGLNLDIFTMGFLGGLNGSFIFNGLKDLNIYNDFVHIKDETPANTWVYEDDTLIFSLKEPNPRITREELDSFYKLYKEIVYKYKFICGLGQVPEGIPKDIYFHLIKMGKNQGRKFILDAKDKELDLAIEAVPFMVKITLEDLEYLSNIKINFESEILRLGYAYIEKGIEILVIDLEEKGTIVLLKDFAYRLEIPNKKYKLNEDKGYLVSGYAFGIFKKYDLDTIMKLGQSMRIAYGETRDINSIDMSDIKRIMGDIEIRKINY